MDTPSNSSSFQPTLYGQRMLADLSSLVLSDQSLGWSNVHTAYRRVQHFMGWDLGAAWPLPFPHDTLLGGSRQGIFCLHDLILPYYF